MARRAFGAQGSTGLTGGSANPKMLDLLPFCPSCENLDRARWPKIRYRRSAACCSAETAPVSNTLP
jgi:hypothetical protein